MATILVIDDDPAMLDYIRIILEDDHEILTAKDGEQGLVICRDTAGLDMIITDIFMPFMDGLEIVREAVKTCPKAKIIAITGQGREGADSYLRLAKDLGADATVSKPFTHQELRAAVDELLA